MQYINIFTVWVLISSAVQAFHGPAGGAKKTYTANMKDMIRKMPFSGNAAAAAAAGDDELFANAGSNMPDMSSNSDDAVSKETAKEAAEEAAEDAAAEEEYVRKGFDEATRKKLRNLAQTFRRKIKNTYRGYDLRPNDLPKDSNGNELTTGDFIYDYAESFRKKDLLDKLQDPNIPNVEKLRLLGEKRFLYDEF